MYGYLFVHITLHGFFSEFSVVRGGGNDGTVSIGCGSPSVLHPWMLLLHMQETALWIPPVCCVLDDICKRQLLWILRGAFCPLEGGPRHIGTDTLAPVLQFPPSGTVWATHRLPCSVTSVVVRWYSVWRMAFCTRSIVSIKACVPCS